MQNSCTALKVSPRNPGDHGVFHRCYSFVFSGLSCSWNQCIACTDWLLSLSTAWLDSLHVLLWLNSSFISVAEYYFTVRMDRFVTHSFTLKDVKCLFQSCAHFLFGYLYCWILRVLWLCWVLALYKMFCKYFLPVWGLSFHSFKSVF